MIYVIHFHDSGGFQSSILSIITYMNEGGSKLSNDAQYVSLPPTNLQNNNKILVCNIYPEHPVYIYIYHLMVPEEILRFNQ